MTLHIYKRQIVMATSSKTYHHYKVGTKLHHAVFTDWHSSATKQFRQSALWCEFLSSKINTSHEFQTARAAGREILQSALCADGKGPENHGNIWQTKTKTAATKRNMGHKVKLTNREVTHIYSIRSFTDDLGRLTKLSPQLIVFQHLVCFGGPSSIDKGDWKEEKKAVCRQPKQTDRMQLIAHHLWPGAVLHAAHVYFSLPAVTWEPHESAELRWRIHLVQSRFELIKYEWRFCFWIANFSPQMFTETHFIVVFAELGLIPALSHCPSASYRRTDAQGFNVPPVQTHSHQNEMIRASAQRDTV